MTERPAPSRLHAANDAAVEAGAAGAAAAADPWPHLVCPLCGGPNACAPAQSGSFATVCWCASATLDRAVLDRLAGSTGARAACICRHCAGTDAGCGTLAAPNRAPGEASAA